MSIRNARLRVRDVLHPRTHEHKVSRRSTTAVHIDSARMSPTLSACAFFDRRMYRRRPSRVVWCGALELHRKVVHVGQALSTFVVFVDATALSRLARRLAR